MLQTQANSERQGHGFAYEQKILAKFGLTKCKNYISEYDAVCGNIRVQVKCIKHGCAVELGCYFRNKNKKQDFIIVIGFWRGTKDNIVEEHIYFIDAEKYAGNLQYSNDASMLEEMKLISNLKEDDLRWKQFCIKHKYDWKTYGNNIDIRFKRDHKKQKRIQCAISWRNYNNWFKQSFEEISSQKFEELISDINNNDVEK
jgi:hypothetical protein